MQEYTMKTNRTLTKVYKVQNIKGSLWKIFLFKWAIGTCNWGFNRQFLAYLQDYTLETDGIVTKVHEAQRVIDTLFALKVAVGMCGVSHPEDDGGT